MIKTGIYISITTLLMIFSISTFGQTFIKNFRAIEEMVEFNNELLFAANDGIHGLELWKTDGTEEGTHLLKDIAWNNRGSSPSGFIVYKEHVYFAAYDNINGRELWRSDGTSEGTVLIKNIGFDTNASSYGNGSDPYGFIIFRDELYFIAAESWAAEIWKTDGTENGTVKVYSTNNNDPIRNLTVVNEDLYFIRGNQSYGRLWKLDGITGGVNRLLTNDHNAVAELNLSNDVLYFTAYETSQEGIGLYKLNPSDDKYTRLKGFVRPIYGNLEIDNFSKANSLLFFTVRTDYDNDPDTDVLWKTDGTAEGTVEVKSFSWARHWSESQMQNFVSFKNHIYFRAGSEHDFSLWKSDGTASGTSQVYDVSIDPYIEPIVSNNNIYFGVNAGGLWVSDGTSVGTKSFSLISLPTYTDPTVFYEAGEAVYFKANDGAGLALWNTIPNAEIEVKQLYRNLITNDNLEFESKVDSCVERSLTVRSIGHKALSISDISISGSEFYLQGNIPQLILPGEEHDLKILFFPHKQGLTRGTLRINSNDLNEQVFVLNLKGITEDSTTALKSVEVDLNKKISFVDSGKINLDNTQIQENLAINTTIGTLSVPNSEEDFTYSLITGEGDRDNNLFNIEDDKIKTGKTFDFELNSTLNIRVQASNGNSGSPIEQVFVIKVLNENENASYSECRQSVTNMSYGLTDVTFVDQSTIVAIGENGAILKSLDAGSTWNEINSGTTAYLRNIQFASDRVGYIVGNTDVILKTTNSGDDWFPVELPSNPQTRNLFFVSPEVGYVFGWDGNVFRTKDGGMNWNYYRPVYATLNAAYFFNEQKGFICGESNTLLKTTDGGENWESLDMSEFGWNLDLKDIWFVNEKIGFIVGEDGEIIKTTDGGDTWQRIGTFATVYATRIHFLNENVGYVIGGWSFSNFEKTEDGGVTWTPVQIERGGGLLGIDFSPDGSNGCIVGSGSSLGGSSESGRSIQIKQNSEAWQSRCMLKPSNYVCTFRVDEETGYFFGQENFKTNDGGLTWKKMEIKNSEGIAAAQFLNANTGFAIDRYGIFKTEDGGDNWLELDEIDVIGTDASSFRSLYFVNANLGFVSGWGNTIYRTSDGGSTWTKNTEVTNSSAILDMAFLDEERGFAVTGNPAKVLKTTDGGLSWQTLNSYPLIWLNSISFIDQNIGLAAGSDGFLLRTEDGGNTWYEVKTGVERDFSSISFLDPLRGYAATGSGGSGTIYETRDGGLNWRLVTQANEFYDMSIAGNSAFFSGRAGTFLRITDGNIPPATGYITGDQLVAENTAIDYSIPANQNVDYIWSVSGNNLITYSLNKAQVDWKEPGTYQLSVTPYNSCGMGLGREINVVVDGMPNPVVNGPDTVSRDSSGLAYSTASNEGSSYIWYVDGGKEYIPNTNEVTVDWGEPGVGLVQVIETKESSGARNQAKLEVIILGDETITGIDLERLFKPTILFPNPATEKVSFQFGEQNGEVIELRILDTSGQLYRNLKLKNSETTEINISDLPNGLYLFELIINNQRTTKRVIKI